jgi:Fanconi anemia group M protein
MIKNFKPRLYQETILASAVSKNTLVVLPTGMGKTNIFLMLAAQRLKQYPSSKILLIGPTKPLIDQYLMVFKEHFEINDEEMAVFTGMVKPEKRAELWKKCKVVFSTPQGLENDIISGRINLEDVSLLGVDEAHRAVGDYAYVFVAKQYDKLARYPRILALTASPGSDMEKIKEVCKNLFIENIEVRTEEDPDVRPYVQEVRIEWVKVNLPTVFGEVQKYLSDFLKERLLKLKKWGILRRADIRYVNKTDLLKLQGQLRGRAAKGEKDFVLWNGISVLAEIMKVQHALELLETQGIISLYKYMEKLNSEGLGSKTKAVKNIVKDLNFRSALIKVQRLWGERIEHPKLVELKRIVKKEVESRKDVKIIVFNQYRDNAVDIKDKLNKIEGVNAEIFVGQLKKGDTGLSQKEQKAVLGRFREGKFNVLVATSIGEEGLDVPQVDLVIFYEPIPSAIRHIQRKGRTGRQEKGRVIILMVKGTRDEGYRWSAHHKEKKMYRHLDKLKRDINYFLRSKKDVKLTKYVDSSDKIRVFADYREKASGIIKGLIDLGVDVKMEKLENADYVLSSRVGVEFKTVGDFVDSIIDGRLLQQVRDLKQNFERPLFIIEGCEDIYSMRNVHPNAIQGMLATIAVSYGIPVLFTKNPKESASLLNIIAKREQEENSKDFALHSNKKAMSLKEWQEYIISALPGVGSNLAKPLLRNFKSVRGVINAKKEQLEGVEKIGPKKAEKIREVVESEWEEQP